MKFPVFFDHERGTLEDDEGKPVDLTELARRANAYDKLFAALKVAQDFVQEVSEKTGFGQDYTLKVITKALQNTELPEEQE